MFMKIITYQSLNVLNILKSGETYRAKPSISLKGQYEALIDMLGLKCQCPVFGVVKGRRQVTGGKISGAVKIMLDVPEKYVKLTEYSVWADFIYAYKFSKPGNYRTLAADGGDITEREYRALIDNLKLQRDVKKYRQPQVILEKINPSWMTGYKKYHGSLKGENTIGRFFKGLKG